MIKPKKIVIDCTLILILAVTVFSCGYYVGEKNSWAEADGFYNPVFKIIKLKVGTQSESTLVRTCIHEAGHHYWSHTLTRSERKEYKEIYENTSEYVSDYANTSVEEDFAETYANLFMFVPIMSTVPEDRSEFFNNMGGQNDR